MKIHFNTEIKSTFIANLEVYFLLDQFAFLRIQLILLITSMPGSESK